jgi:hypothetical protein
LSFFNVALCASALFGLTSAAPTEEVPPAPEVVVTASFPEANIFGHVVNGEKNSLRLQVENKSDRNVTLTGVYGSAHNAQTGRTIKNLTTQNFNVPLIEGMALEIPYVFFSEFKTGDLGLKVWLDHTADGHKYQVSAYDSVVTVVEPSFSIFDIKLILTYIIVLGIFGGAGYLTYLSYFPQATKKTKRTEPSSITSPVGTVTATGAGGYQEEWIPEHHLRKKNKSSGVATSGDELSASEVSGTEGKRRKGRK